MNKIILANNNILLPQHYISIYFIIKINALLLLEKICVIIKCISFYGKERSDEKGNV